MYFQTFRTGHFLPGGGFLPNRARQDDPGISPKLPVTADTYDEVNASEELVALARIARETMKRKSDASAPQIVLETGHEEDGYVQPIEKRQSVASAAPQTQQDPKDYDMATSYRHNTSQEPPAEASAAQVASASPKPGIPRRVK